MNIAVEIDLDFHCSYCGKELDVSYRYNKVDAHCPNCFNGFNATIEAKEEEVETLKEIISELEEIISNLEKNIK